MLFYPKQAREDAGIVVIIPQYHGKLVFVRHRDRQSFEFPAGHREEGESLLEAARRELHEESGAADFSVWPVTFYGVLQGNTASYGQLFFANIERFEDIPPFEIAERFFLDEAPAAMTYGEVQLQLLEKVRKWKIEKRTLLYCFPGSEAKRSWVTRALESCHFDSVYAWPDTALQKELAPLVNGRKLVVTPSESLGVSGAAAFTENGVAAFDTLLAKENGRSVVVALHDDLYEVIFHRYEDSLRINADAWKEKYEKIDGISDGVTPKKTVPATRTQTVLRLECIDDILIEVRDAWTTES